MADVELNPLAARFANDRVLPRKGGKAHKPNGGPSLFEKFFQLLEQTGALSLNFEDVSGVSFDVPDLALSAAHHWHQCRFCTLAKSTRASHLDCIRNKMAVNRIALRRQAGFTGICHLGLTDIVEPLVYHGRVLGIFYYGSVVVKGDEAAAKKRIEKYCRRRKLNPSLLLNGLKKTPRIDRSELPRYRERLLLISELATRVLDTHGLPLERYRTEIGAQFVNSRLDIPPLVQGAMRFIHKRYSEPLQVVDIANHLKCHPDYLSRVFKKSVACGLGEYVMRVRVDRARYLIETKRFSTGEIAWYVGFQDQSHFGRVFKRLLGVTPGKYVGASPPLRLNPEQSLDMPDLSRLRNL